MDVHERYPLHGLTLSKQDNWIRRKETSVKFNTARNLHLIEFSSCLSNIIRDQKRSRGYFGWGMLKVLSFYSFFRGDGITRGRLPCLWFFSFGFVTIISVSFSIPEGVVSDTTGRHQTSTSNFFCLIFSFLSLSPVVLAFRWLNADIIRRIRSHLPRKSVSLAS
jgi:hypothetical protein